MLTANEIEQIIHSGLPAAKRQQLHINEIGKDWAVVSFPVTQDMLRPGGTISGPTLMGLADAAMFAAIMAALGRLEMAVTQNLTIHFLRKPLAELLIAKAQILRLGKRSVVLEVSLYGEGQEEKPAAQVTGTYALPVE